MASAGREIELKLRIARADVPRLLRHSAVRAARRAPARTARLVSIYFDTADDALARAGIALRLRRDGTRWVQTLKGPADSGSGAGIASRPEFEHPLARGAQPPPLEPAQWAATPWRAVLDAAHQDHLVPRFATDFSRTTVPVALDEGTRAHLCVDIGEVRDGRGRASPIAEVEIELDEGALAPLYRLAERLCAGVPLAVETRSKAARGYALTRPAAARPARAAHPPIGSDDAAAPALQTLLRACARQIADNADGVLCDDDPEWIHQLRIGTRRLRSCLALLRDTVPEERRAAVAGDAQWLARALGPARDLDVLVDETLPALQPAIDAARPLARFARRADEARRQAREAARAAVASPRFTRLLLGAGELAATPRLGVLAGAPAADALAQPARAFARPWLARRHRKLLRLARKLPDATPEERHAIRLAAKRLRYVTEFFADAFPGRRTRAYRKALARLQDALGAQVDAQVALRIAYAMEGTASPAAQVLEAHIARNAASADAALMRRWRAFRACPRFFPH